MAVDTRLMSRERSPGPPVGASFRPLWAPHSAHSAAASLRPDMENLEAEQFAER